MGLCACIQVSVLCGSADLRLKSPKLTVAVSEERLNMSASRAKETEVGRCAGRNQHLFCPGLWGQQSEVWTGSHFILPA